ncbi:MAG: hypothetical protein HY900_05360, partial [Deltaproteobacteria bacterium]|nr:hypothetical protein [Deltaproteobacteria bacterium]
MELCLVSGKGGTGKTTLAVGLAVATASAAPGAAEPVELVDCDVEAPNAHLYFAPHALTRLPVFCLKPLPFLLPDPRQAAQGADGPDEARLRERLLQKGISNHLDLRIRVQPGSLRTFTPSIQSVTIVCASAPERRVGRSAAGGLPHAWANLAAREPPTLRQPGTR